MTFLVKKDYWLNFWCVGQRKLGSKGQDGDHSRLPAKSGCSQMLRLISGIGFLKIHNFLLVGHKNRKNFDAGMEYSNEIKI